MRRRDEAAVLDESLNADIETMEWRNGDGLRYRRPEVGERVLRKLSKGQFRIEAELDLHGYTVREAREVMRDFLQECALALALPFWFSLEFFTSNLP